MKIFLSYASEDAGIAGQINSALTSEDHIVFFSDDDIHPTEAYDRKIREDIEKSDLFVFLISPDSVKKGKYTLTELNFAEGNWESLAGNVMPVMIRDTPPKAVPSSLARLNILKAKGDLVAEVAGAVARIARVRAEKERAGHRIPPSLLRTALVGVGCFAVGALSMALAPRVACGWGWGSCDLSPTSAVMVDVKCKNQNPNDTSSRSRSKQAYVLVKGKFEQSDLDAQIARLKSIKSATPFDVIGQDTIKGESRFNPIEGQVDDRNWAVLAQEVDRGKVSFLLPKLDPSQQAHFFIEFDGDIPVTGDLGESTETTADAAIGEAAGRVSGIRELANFKLEEDTGPHDAAKITKVDLNLYQGKIDCWENSWP
jgi:hypothetical protein